MSVQHPPPPPSHRTLYLNALLLQHYIFPSGGDGLYLVVDEKSRFREDNFQKAMAVLQAGPDDEIAQAGNGGAEGGGGSSAKAKKKKDGKVDNWGENECVYVCRPPSSHALHPFLYVCIYIKEARVNNRIWGRLCV